MADSGGCSLLEVQGSLIYRNSHEQLFQGKNHNWHTPYLSTQYFGTRSCKIKMADPFVWTVLHERLGGSSLLSLIFFGILGESVKLGKFHFGAFKARIGEKCMFLH